MTLRRAWILICVVFIAVTVAGGFRFRELYGGPRVVARAITAEGVELRVIQDLQGEFPSVNTAVYVRHPGEAWRWFYYDHEDFPWRRGEATVDGAKHLITIRCEEKVTATYDYEAFAFALLRDDFPHRITHGGDFLAPGAEPPRR